MRAAPGTTLTVCIDFKNPHAWLAVPPTLAMADDLGIDIEWLPRIAAPIERPSAEAADDDRGTRHRRIRAEYAAHDIERYAAVHGLTIRNVYRRPDVTTAALGLLWARRAGAEIAGRYVEAVFAAHWSERLDIEDPSAIDALLESTGAPIEGRAAYRKNEGPAELEALQERLVEQGVYTTPAYLLADQLYIGRAHLPRIRARLLGDGVDAGQGGHGNGMSS